MVTNPELSGSTYALASGSPAFSTLHFQPIGSGWGPQGFVVPANLPSSV